MPVRIAAIQTDPSLGNVAKNLEGILAAIKATTADLLVFPECALTGYGFGSLEEGWRISEAIPGPSAGRIAEACRTTKRHAIVGMLERSGDRLYNCAVLFGPDGVVGGYRKAHLPHLGIDRFATPGDSSFPVFELPFGRAGILICYDLSFPEAARVLKLDGAQVICVPTNWPIAAEVSCCHAPPVRAQENHVNVVTCDRVGEEAGFRFRGGSRIVDFGGRTLAEAGDRPAVITAELDLQGADQNRVVHNPGLYELDRIGHRRPELYGRLVEGGDRKP
jgi:predicted amidohydrolase